MKLWRLVCGVRMGGVRPDARFGYSVERMAREREHSTGSPVVYRRKFAYCALSMLAKGADETWPALITFTILNRHRQRSSAVGRISDTAAETYATWEPLVSGCHSAWPSFRSALLDACVDAVCGATAASPSKLRTFGMRQYCSRLGGACDGVCVDSVCA